MSLSEGTVGNISFNMTYTRHYRILMTEFLIHISKVQRDMLFSTYFQI